MGDTKKYPARFAAGLGKCSDNPMKPVEPLWRFVTDQCFWTLLSNASAPVELGKCVRTALGHIDEGTGEVVCEDSVGCVDVHGPAANRGTVLDPQNKVHGVRFSSNGGGVQFENTATAVIALQTLLEDPEKYGLISGSAEVELLQRKKDEYLHSMETVIKKYGSLPGCSLLEGCPSGFEYSYFAVPHLVANALGWMAMKRVETGDAKYNPYSLGIDPKTGAPVSVSLQWLNENAPRDKCFGAWAPQHGRRRRRR